jgi:hypothetical protein
MKAWHSGGAGVVLLLAASLGQAQTCLLSESVQVGDCFHISIDMKLQGEMRFRKDTGNASVKLTASASHSFPERVLQTAGPVVSRVARAYERATVNINRGSDQATCTLRPERNFIVAQRIKEQFLAFSPRGAMFRNEVELVSDHFDTLSLTGVLPGKEVKPGDTWKIPNGVAAALCALEGITENQLEGKFDHLQGQIATLSVQGTAVGVETGALVKLSVEAIGTYDLASKRLTKLVWKQKSDRDQGPVSPASTLDMTVTLTRRAIAQPAELDDITLKSVPSDDTPPGPMTNIEFRDAKGRFTLVHPRDWYLTAVTADHTVLRLLDRGDYIAQLTVTPWTTARKGEHLSPEQFKKAMSETSGWRPEKELQSGEVPAEDKYIYRTSVVGQLDGVSVLQNFFLVAAPTGEQVVLTFTLAPKMADRLGARDLSIAASIEVPSGK